MLAEMGSVLGRPEIIDFEMTAATVSSLDLSEGLDLFSGGLDALFVELVVGPVFAVVRTGKARPRSFWGISGLLDDTEWPALVRGAFSLRLTWL